MELLIIEDDPVIGKALHKGFAEAGHHADWVKDGKVGLERAQSQLFDAVVLDLMLPVQPGLDLLRQLRARGIHTPVIVLTALGSVDQRVEGLQAGADDYMVKPFAFAELLARLEAVCRRVGLRPASQLQAGSLTLDLATRRVTCAGFEIDLTPTEFSLLEMLMRHAGQVVTRKMLCEHLWESDWEGTTNVIEVHINRLRGKLSRCTPEPLIHTIRGRGYALRAPMGDVPDPALPGDRLEHRGGGRAGDPDAGPGA
jgi:two-component system OmpR family response regulator/two-component system copper resistance phosphate regulon response regulator CusR